MQTKGAIALITGGARGLGQAISCHLQNCGATVIVWDRDAEALRQIPTTMDGLQVDVTHPLEVKAALSTVLEKHGRIDILVNNAGLIYSEPLFNLMNPESPIHDYTRFRNTLTANLDSVFIVTSAIVEQMIQRRTRGVVVNISSISAQGNEGQTAYSAAKAGVNAMTVTWAKELGRWGIRSNAVAPGFIDTESTRSALTESSLKHITSNTPLRRLGMATEVAQAVTTLIENDFINGAVLNVNGGLTI